VSEATLGLAPETLAATAAGLRAWLSSGRCQTASGAFVAWVDLADNDRSYEYPEISGYALTYFAGQVSLSEREQAAAQRAAEWLVERVRAGNLAARDGWDNDSVYLFDLGMIASGLLGFGRRTRTERFVASGLALVTRLGDELSFGGPISPLSRHGAHSGREGWSTRGVAHLAKLSQAFLLSLEFGIAAGRTAAARLIDTVKQLQEPDGRIPTNPQQTTVMLHPHLYAAEALWIWGSAVGDDEALEGARAALAWVWKHQLEQGGLPRSDADGTRNGGATEQSDVTAQAARLALALGLRSAAVDRALARMVEVAQRDAEGLGIVYQPETPNAHLNTWATLFATQAFALAIPDAPRITWRELV
jgi:hypothetical protein